MNRLITVIGCCLGLACVISAQEVPPEITDPEEREILALAIKLNRVSLAYKITIVERMLVEANFFSDKLKLVSPHPITLSDLLVQYAVPLWNNKIDGTNMNLSKAERIRQANFVVTGRIGTTNYDFSFNGGRLWNIQRLKIKNEDSIFELYPELAKTPSLIDTNGAYQLATQWLSAVSVDVPALERKHKLSFFQWFFWGKPEDLPKDHWTYNAPTATNKTMLPIYDVKWGEGDTPAVKVTVLGSMKELWELQINDGSVSKRPLLVISNALELNSRPDPPVKHLEHLIEEPQTNSISHTNSPLQRPPPFRQQIKPKQ